MSYLQAYDVCIEIPKESSATLQTAKRELAECMGKCGIRTDNAARVIISLGETNRLKAQTLPCQRGWKQDSFGSFVKDNTIYIYGGSDRAVLYGVYEFLETVVGVRFYAPDESFFPILNDGLLIPIDYYKDETPCFDIRSYWTLDAMLDAQYSARMRMMTLWYDEENAKDYGGGMRDIYFNDGHNINRIYTEGYVSIHGEPTDGTVIYSGGKDIKTGKDLTLTYSRGAHPSRMGMICLSDPAIRKYLVRGMIERVRKHPDCVYFGLQQEDTPFFCSCEACANNQNKSNILVNLCNDVAKQVNAWSQGEGRSVTGGKKIYIVTLAYEYTEMAPTLPVDEHVIVTLALIKSMNYAYAYGDEKNQTDSSQKAIRQWESVVPSERLLFYYYATNFNNEHWYCSNLQCLLPSIQYMAKYGKLLATLEAGEEFLNSWQALMRMYICKNLLWSPEDYTQEDVMNLACEFCDGYYGEYADVVYQYVLAMENEYDRIRSEYGKTESVPYFVAVADHILINTNYQEASTDAYGERHCLTANDPKYFTPGFLTEQAAKLRTAYAAAKGSLKKRLASVLLTADIMYFVNWKYYNVIDESVSYTEIASNKDAYPEFKIYQREIKELVMLTDDSEKRVRSTLNLIFGIDEYAGMDGSRHYDFWAE